MQPHEFKVNDYITLKLEGRKTNIYLNGTLFQQCKYLAFNISLESIPDYDAILSIDDLEDRDRGVEYEKLDIAPEEEFWGHCSNLQAWVENEYDIRLLHRTLAFPLLKALANAGDPVAKKALKSEIASRISSGNETIVNYLVEGGYLNHFTADELTSLFPDMEHVMRNGIPIPVIAGILRLSEKGVKDLSELEGLLELKLLKKLYLGDNQLHSLPEWLGQLQSLQWLYLQNNQLQALLDSSANTTFKELKKKGISIQS